MHLNPCHSTMGRDELSPGLLPLLHPTLFDQVVDSMRLSIKERLDWDFFNLTAWKLLGVNGGPIRKWLHAYIEISAAQKRSFNPFYEDDWIASFAEKGIDPESSGTYLDVFSSLRESGRVPDEIWSPFNYQRDEDTPLVRGMKAIGKYAVVGIVAYGIILQSPKILKGFKK